MKRIISSILFISFVFLFAAAFIVDSSVATNGEKAAKKTQQIFIPKGDDAFQTPDNGETLDDFSETPIPAEFFGQGSLPYKGTVVLKGKPMPDYGDNVDCVITRENSGTVPFTTRLRIRALSLVSSCPITVSYRDGHTEKWDVAVSLSPSAASTGAMTIKADGTFDSRLEVFPLFTFAPSRDADPQPSAVSQESRSRELDTGSTMVQMYLRSLRNKESGSNAEIQAPTLVVPVKLASTGTKWRLVNDNFVIIDILKELEKLARHLVIQIPRGPVQPF